jgi:hypothetical protein
MSTKENLEKIKKAAIKLAQEYDVNGADGGSVVIIDKVAWLEFCEVINET